MAFWLTAIMAIVVLVFAAMILRHLDRRDMRRADLVEDAIAAAAQHGGIELVAAVTALAELEYGAYGREHLRLVTEFAVTNARIKLVEAKMIQLKPELDVLDQGTRRLRQSLRELPAVAKRILP